MSESKVPELTAQIEKLELECRAERKEGDEILRQLERVILDIEYNLEKEKELEIMNRY